MPLRFFEYPLFLKTLHSMATTAEGFDARKRTGFKQVDSSKWILSPGSGLRRRPEAGYGVARKRATTNNASADHPSRVGFDFDFGGV
jgi:hypothetical protein